MKTVVKQISLPDERSAICNSILRSMPKWFGIESAIVDYVNDVKKMDTWVVEINNETAGFISVNKHNSSTAEIHVIGVLEKFHRQKTGEELVRVAEESLLKEGFKFFSVKTLSELREDENYAKTRKFYLKMGFLPVEVFKTLWGEHNPCLFMIKNLSARIPKIRPLALALIKRDDGCFLFHCAQDRVKKEIFYRPLGGGVEFGESGEVAIAREIEEELSLKVNVTELVATFENIFSFEGKPGHEIVLLYQTVFVDKSKYSAEAMDIVEGDKVVGKAVWKTVAEIKKEGAKLYPLGIEKVLV